MLKLTLVVVIAALITACSPKFDWREVHGTDSPYTVLMPARPSELSRDIQLNAQTVTMHMTATQIDGVDFAVGSVKMSDATNAQLTITVIKNALVQKMAGFITQEKTSLANTGGKLTVNDEFTAIGKPPATTRMQGHIVARDEWVFQVLVVGPEKEFNKEAADTFLTSFKAN